MTGVTVAVEKTIRGEVIAEERRALNVYHCPGCGVLYALDAEYNAERRADGKSYYCPNGCALSYSETEAKRLKKQLADERTALNRTQDLLNAEKSAHEATKGALTKATKRSHAGVCPECHRTFEQVARHMASKHKDA